MVLLLSTPLSVSANTTDIEKMIREAQAQAIENLGGITACDAETVMEESKRILREEYGVSIEDISISDFDRSENAESLYGRGYDDGYDDGFKDGILEAERKAAAEKEEMKNNRMGAYFSIAVVVAISFVVTTLDKIKYRRK